MNVEESRELTVPNSGALQNTWSPKQVKEQIDAIQLLMRDAMKKDEHFGTIPGTDKPVLLKAGAEKLCLMFRIAPRYEEHMTDLGGGHREHRITCSIYSIATGDFIGQGVGSCSTMESKYRYRNVADFEVVDSAIPADAKENKTAYRKQGFGMKKVNGVWVWVKYKDESRVENPDIADTYNTVLKMAKKRAFVDAVITATAASDIFTQDLEEAIDPSPKSDEQMIRETGMNLGDQPGTHEEPAIKCPECFTTGKYHKPGCKFGGAK